MKDVSESGSRQMIDLSILSAVYLEYLADSVVKEQFAEFSDRISREREKTLDDGFFKKRGREIEHEQVMSVVGCRSALFDVSKIRACCKLLESGAILFRGDDSMDLGEVVGQEIGGFFDYWETPPPRYWIDFRFIPKETRKPVVVGLATAQEDAYYHGRTILVSWIPAELEPRVRQVTPLSCTGTLIWLDEILELEGPDYYMDMFAMASEYNQRLCALRALA